MSDEIKIQITGLDEVCDALATLPPKLAKQGLRKALQAGGKPLRDSMAAKVQKGWHVWQDGTREGKGRSRDYGFVSTHIAVRTEIKSSELEGVAHVGPVKKGYWALFLEFGTQKMRAFPFMRPAYEEQKENALNAFVESLRSTFNDIFRK